ncbi:MAG: hypothetical protein K2H09_05440 [Treponemataceae bacterium]|nr:hypothetical protein [Treponemataceae bacterium]
MLRRIKAVFGATLAMLLVSGTVLSGCQDTSSDGGQDNENSTTGGG